MARFSLHMSVALSPVSLFTCSSAGCERTFIQHTNKRRGGVMGLDREYGTREHKKLSIKTQTAGFIKQEQAENDHPSGESAVAAVKKLAQACTHTVLHNQLLRKGCSLLP